MDFISVAQAAEDGDRVFHAGLADLNRLEPSLQCGVLLDVLAVFVQRGRADGVQLATRQHRLEHVGGIHRSFGSARAHDGVKLVDEENDLTRRGLNFLQHRLEALLELTTELGAGDQRAQVEGDNALVLEPLRNIATNDALRESFGDRCLADAGFTDKDRVVFGSA